MTKTHKMIKTSEYQAWANMKQRCFNTNNPRYLDYGKRSIIVCDRWKNSFENFFADMGLKPSPDYSLDRIDNNKNYSHENCRWSTCVEQQNNRRSNHLITIDNETRTIAQWAKKIGISVQVISTRLYRGWSEKDAVLTLVETVKPITIENETLTIAQWSKKMGYGETVITNRLNMGWFEYDAVMTPVHINKVITIENDTRTISQWTKKMGYGETVIKSRLKMGWSEYDAVLTPVETGKLITIENETLTIDQWEKKMGFGNSVIRNRLKLGWSEFDAVMTPVRIKK